VTQQDTYIHVQRNILWKDKVRRQRTQQQTDMYCNNSSAAGGESKYRAHE